MEKALILIQLVIGYRTYKGVPVKVAGPIDLNMENGQLNCLIGPNGVGKSTLLRTIAGIQPAISGHVKILGELPDKMKSEKLARLLSIVLTDRIGHGNLKAFDVVAMGRTPYTGWFGTLDNEDRMKVAWAIEMTGITDLIDKNILELSDGERQKVMIARALAQDTPLMLLDEPTAHLDLPNRIEIVRLLRKLTAETNKAIVMSTHELDLALQAADNIWLMTSDRTIYSGAPEDLVLNDIFGRTFTKKGIDFDKNQGIFRLVEPHDKVVSVTGSDPGAFWTKRALERQGFQIVVNEHQGKRIDVTSRNNHWQWNWVKDGKVHSANSIESMLQQLTGEGEGDD
jgi:iron complex transport system ATP-binding protein